MGDLFLHLGFARRLRFADGLHPVVVETFVRQPAAVVVTATLPLLPAIEQRGASLLRRLLGRGKAESARWSRQLGVMDEPRGDLALALLGQRAQAPGQMTRLALALGALSHAVLEASVGETTRDLDGAERAAVERGQARLWLQFAVPSLRDLAGEWAPAAELDEPERVRRALEHLDASLAVVHGEGPGADALARWTRALAGEVAPLVDRAALPPEGAMPEHEVRSRYFEGEAAFLERAQRAIHWFVYLANQLGSLYLGREPSDDEVRDALCDESAALRAVPDDFDVEASRAAWHARVREVREDALGRGRNPKPAYYDEISEIAEALPPLPPLPDDASGPVQVPTRTQEISAADIEDELPDLPAPTTTQEISAADIEAELESSGVPPLETPAMTQEISAADIEAELEAPPDGEVPPAPTTTQQISAADIEAELSADAEEAGEGAPEPAAEPAAGEAPPEEPLASPQEAAPPAEAPPAEAPPAEPFPSPPKTPPLGTLPADAPPPSVSAPEPTPSPEEKRTKTPPLGTPVAEPGDAATNGVQHDAEADGHGASADEAGADEPGGEETPSEGTSGPSA